MGVAKYTVHVPADDEFGNPLRLHHAVQKHMENIGMEPATVHKGHPHNTVVGWAEDNPEWDSTAKQIGAYAGEIANVPYVTVTKEGDKSASWPIPNRTYQQGFPAESAAMARGWEVPTQFNDQLTLSSVHAASLLERLSGSW